MAYEKTWVHNEKLNKSELRKLEKDGLEILNDIPKYAKQGFDSIPKEDWDLFKWAGLYLQKPKEDGYFMMRVKVPSGVLTGAQAETLAGISRDYGRGVFDVTTRQAIQFHWLEIEEIPDIFERLDHVGLTSVGACGDIARNVVGNPLAGVDRDELLDTQPLVNEVHNFFYKNEDFSNLPRKFKISISANVHNVSHAEINCIAFVPAVKEIEGELVTGFHVKVGGGLSAKPHLAQELDIFVKPEEVKDVAVGVTTIFRDFGYRKSRTRARLKYLVADWGIEKFKEKLLELTGELPAKGETKFKQWNAGYFYGVHPQKQEGLSYVGFNVPMGRLDAEEVFELGRVSKQYGNGEIRTCHSQNIVIPNIPDEKVDELLEEPVFQRLSIEPKNFIGYSLSCTGTEYCNLALVETKERMKRIAEYLDAEISVDQPIRIHMVGCPNSCAQRHIADIGLQGVLSRTRDKKVVEAFQLCVGGTLDDGGEFNKKLKGKVSGDDLAPVLKEFIGYYNEHKNPGERFYDFVVRVGTEPLQQALDDILVKAVA
jgi:ferredoxin-nitrite reductase